MTAKRIRGADYSRLELLPSSILGHCLGFLEPPEAARAAHVSTTFRVIAESSMVVFQRLLTYCPCETPTQTQEEQYYLTRAGTVHEWARDAGVEHHGGHCRGHLVTMLNKMTQLQVLSLDMAQNGGRDGESQLATVLAVRIAQGLRELSLINCNQSLLAELDRATQEAPRLSSLTIILPSCRAIPMSFLSRLRELSLETVEVKEMAQFVPVLRATPRLESLDLDIRLPEPELALLLEACPVTVARLSLALICFRGSHYQLPGRQLLELLRRFPFADSG